MAGEDHIFKRIEFNHMDATMATCAVSVSVADVRRFPDSSSELVTQALLNVPVLCGEVRDEWVFATLSDYEGWMRTADLAEPAVKGFTKIGETCATPLDLVAVVQIAHTSLYADPAGQEIYDTAYLSTVLPLLDTTHADYLQIALPDEQVAWVSRAAVSVQRQDEAYPHTSLQKVIEHAQSFLGVPYLWGGTSWKGIDCSGFVQVCYRMAGYCLPRDADQQHDALPLTVAREAMQMGDLIFFGSERITHVGMALNAQEFIHASGRNDCRVVINSFDPTAPHYSARLADVVWAIKRVVS
jgi:cell wall-associated NlpC family hydrolase